MDSSPTNEASDKSCEAWKGLGVGSQRRGYRQQGALVSGVFVQLGHPWCRLEWGNVHNLADMCKEVLIGPNYRHR